MILDFVCGDELYGNCTKLRDWLEEQEQAYVLRVPKNFRITLGDGAVLTCEDAVATLPKHARRWEVRSAGRGSRGDRWYAWAWIRTASPRHSLLVRRHLKSGELAFHYCYVPEGQLCTMTRLIRAAGLRCRRRIRVRQGLLRAGPVPGPALPCDRPAHCPGHGRPRDLRRHRRPPA